jgi:hypothetical protein
MAQEAQAIIKAIKAKGETMLGFRLLLPLLLQP